ncbi:MAG: Ig-like domain-containing protein [Opitutales bacterium]
MPATLKCLSIAVGSVLLYHSTSAQVSFRSDTSAATPTKSFFYNWNGFEVQWYGPSIGFVDGDEFNGAPVGGRSFTQPYSQNSFAYEISAVMSWDTATAVQSIVDPDSLPGINSFLDYLAGLTPAEVNKHGGSQYGLGVENNNNHDADGNQIDANRRDKIDDVGEALVIQFDLQGSLAMPDPANADETQGESYTFGPDDSYTFENTGLNEYAALTLEELYIKKYSTANNPTNARIDFLFYDVSENTFVQDSLDGDAFYEYLNLDASNFILTGPWTIEHGDILILAHPTNEANNLSMLSNELWSMTFDLDFNPPPAPTIEIPADPADFPQHPYTPGFQNIWREDGETVAMYRTEQNNDTTRTVVMDFHRGYLLTENRGTSDGNKGTRIVFDISGTSAPLNEGEDPNTRFPSEFYRDINADAGQHNAWMYAPDHRINRSQWADVSDMSDVHNVGFPDGYVGVGSNGLRSAYVLPYHYSSPINSGFAVWDARTNTQLSLANDHGFGGMVMPVGNIMLISQLRAGEKAVATYDISDPSAPVLLDVLRGENPQWRNTAAGSYEPSVYNHYMVIPASVNGGSVTFVDYSDPANLRVHEIVKPVEGSERYIQFKDHRMFAGTEVIDITHLDGGIVSREHNFPGHKGEYMLPLGNLVVCAENSEQGAENMGAIFAFQAEPDVVAPKVTYHIPAAGAEHQRVTSRIGLMIHETLDLTSLNENTLKVFPVSDLTETSIDGTRTASDKDIITFTPNAPLSPETTYRVVAEGIKDIVGNPMERFTFDFTTEGPDSLWYPIVNNFGFTNTDDLLVNQPVYFSFDASPDNGEDPSTLEYQWDFGDGKTTAWSNENQSISHSYTTEGLFRIKAKVRSVNAPSLSVARSIQVSIIQKAAGEDGFEPRLEAENMTNSSIGESESASNGAYSRAGSVPFTFNAVPGVYDFVLRFSHDKNNGSHREYDIFFSKGTLNEDGSYSYTEIQEWPSLIPANTTWEESVNAVYITEAGRYRVEARGNEDGARRPRLDYLDILIGDQNMRLEAENVPLENIVNGTITASEDASAGAYVKRSGGFSITWEFDAGPEGGLFDAAFGVASNRENSNMRRLDVILNGNLLPTQLERNVKSFEPPIPYPLELVAGVNTIELSDPSNGRALEVDYMDILIPEYIPPEVLMPQSSGQMALDSTNRLIISINPDNDTITAINADTLAKEWEKAVATNPRSLAIDANGLIWVACHEGDTISIIDPINPANDQELALNYGSGPHDIVFNQDKTIAYISLYTAGQVIQLDATLINDPQADLLIDTVDVGPFPAALALNPGGSELYATRFISPTDNGELYVVAIDAETGVMTAQPTISLAKEVDVEDGNNQGRGVPNYLSSIVINADGTRAFVASQKVNTLAGELVDPTGTILNHDSTVRSILSKVDLASKTEDFEGRHDFDSGSQPSALTFSSRGDYIFVAMQGNNHIRVINTVLDAEVLELETDLAPQGLIFDEATNRLFVKNFMGRTITVHELNQAMTTGDFTNTTPQDISTVANEVLPDNILLGKQIFYNADDLRMSDESYMSCASCHQNGGHDGVVWDFTQRGEGLRNTTDLRGRAGMGHGNVHWSANFDEIQDFELDIVNEFDGNGFIENGTPHPSMGTPNAGRSDDLDALAAYVASLAQETIPASPNRQADGTLTPDALHGKRLFEGQLTLASGNTLNCIECHVSEFQFTNSVISNDSFGAPNLHDIGTLKSSSGGRLDGSLTGIDTPTLWGLHDGGPYLHDGSAATIEAVFDQFDANAAIGEDGAAHNLGATGYNLTLEEKASLLAYLYQIDGTDLQQMNANTWMASWGPNPLDPNADIDGDTLNNFSEYIFGGNPFIANGPDILPRIVSENGEFKFRLNWRSNDPDIQYAVQNSLDLETWTEASLSVSSVEALSDYIDSIDFSIPMDTAEKFFRLSASD